MNKDNKIYVSQKGYDQYLEALEDLINQRKDIMRARGGLEKGRSPSGGMSGNYTTVINDQDYARVSSAIESISEEISRLVVVSNENVNESEVGIGDIVTLLQVDVNEVGKYRLTGGMMPNIDAEIQEITIRSPLGKAIQGKKVGDTASYFVDDRSGSRRDFTVQILSKENGLEKEEAQPE